MACHLPLTALVVIDPAVADACKNDNQILLQDALSHTKVLTLDAHRDGIAQITEALINLTNIEQLHLIAASGSGLRLGSIELTLFNLDRYGWQLQQWGNSFAPNAQILIHGCPKANSIVISFLSTPFVTRLCLLTGAPVTVLDQRIDQTAWPNQTSKQIDSLLMG